MFRCLLAATVLLHLIAIADAEELCKFPTDRAAWRIEFSYPTATVSGTTGGKTSNTGRRLKTVEATQDSELQRLRLTWDDGAKTEQWKVKQLHYILVENPNTGSVAPLQEGDSIAKQKNLLCDESAFTWLASHHLQESKPLKFQNKNCFHYKATVTTRFHDNAASEAPVNYEAWIDEETLLPVGLSINGDLRLFTFLPPPTERLTLPPKFKKLIDYYKRIMGIPDGKPEESP